MMRVLMSPERGPMYWGTSVVTDREKICPTGALWKNGFLKSRITGSAYRLRVDGKLPLDRNPRACCPGAVSHSASSVACAGCRVCFGTVSHEPPQFPPPP